MRNIGLCLVLTVFLPIVACNPSGGSLPQRGSTTSKCKSGSHGSSGENCGNFFSRFFNYAKGKIAGVNWSAGYDYIKRLGSSSGHKCARGVRKTLNALFGEQRGDNPIGACKYNEAYFDKLWPRTPAGTNVDWSPSGGRVAPGCVNVCKVRGVACGDSVSNAGHIEIYSDAGWTSDFKQGGSICASNPRFEGTRTYCPHESSRLALYLFQKRILKYALLTFNIPTLEAGESVVTHKYAISSVKQNKETYTVGPVDNYKLEVLKIEDPNVALKDRFTVVKISRGKEKEVLVSYANAFSALMSVPNKKTRRDLAAGYVKKLIELYGFEEMQRLVSSQSQLYELQRDAYLDNGLVLAETYYILEK